MNKIKSIIFNVMFLTYIGLILFVLFAKFDGMPQIQLNFLGIPKDKIFHFVMFFPFAFITCKSLGKSYLRHKMLVFIIVLIIGFLFAAATEMGQGLTTYRSRDIADFYADAIGLIAGSLLLLI
ncbi:MAG: VanZ family protein [Bacteroidales bacterium]|nr:VanZ family protein [Bacteroidales bacterium]